MCLVMFDVRHVVGWIGLRALASGVVNIISTSKSVEDIVEGFQDVCVRLFLRFATSVATTIPVWSAAIVSG